MSDQRMREAARHAPGSLEELAWGLRTGALRPRDPSQALTWFPSRRQIQNAAQALRCAGYMSGEEFKGYVGYTAWIVLCYWDPTRRWHPSEAGPGEPVFYCPPSRPRQHGIPPARVSERLLRWSRFVLDAAGATRIQGSGRQYERPAPT